MEVIHKKTGETYYVEDVVIDATNNLDPEKQVKILYSNTEAQKFVREANEFFEKFETPEGFNILSKACELAMINIDKFRNKCTCAKPINTNDMYCNCGDNCSCNHDEEYRGEMIDPQVYNTYKQTVENRWYVPVYIVRSLACNQLSELFTIRCSDFDIIKKEYDNATSEYFLLGYRTSNDFPKNPCQVCKLPRKVFDRLYEAVKIEEDKDDDLFDD